MEAGREHLGLERSGAVHREEGGVEFSRIVAFSDGVFAIAITLLVLAIEVPENAPDLGQILRSQEGDFLAYALSFAVVGKFWLAHHRFFSALLRFDNTLMGLNLVYLAGITLVPFTSEVLGDYGDAPAAYIVYATNMAFVSVTFSGCVFYAYRRGLMRPETKAFERRYAGPANFLTTAVFALSIPIALVSTFAAVLIWTATFVIGRRTADKIAGIQRSD